MREALGFVHLRDQKVGAWGEAPGPGEPVTIRGGIQSLKWSPPSKVGLGGTLRFRSLSWLCQLPSLCSLFPLSPFPFSLSPTGLEKAILHEFLCKNINSINTLNEYGRRVFSSWASDETSALANTWVIAWWDPEAKNSDKPCSDFLKTEIINMCYLRLRTLWESVVQQ